MKLKYKATTDKVIDTESGTIEIKTVKTEQIQSPELINSQKEKLGKIISCNIKMAKEIAASKSVATNEGLAKITSFYAKLNELVKANDVDFEAINQSLILKHSVLLSNAIQAAQRYILSQAAEATFDIEFVIDGPSLCSLVREVAKDDQGIEASMLQDLPNALTDFFVNVINERRVRYGSI